MSAYEVLDAAGAVVGTYEYIEEAVRVLRATRADRVVRSADRVLLATRQRALPSPPRGLP